MRPAFSVSISILSPTKGNMSMINHPEKKINRYIPFALNDDFMEKALVNLYDTVIQEIKNGGIYLLLACCMVMVNNAKDIIFYGFYTRTFTDVQRVCKNGRWGYEVVKGKLKIQRIKCSKCDEHTHALLFDFLIPSGHYSVRFILYHLNLYFKSGKSIEEFCADYEGLFSERTFKKWLHWLDTHMDMLIQKGMVLDVKEKKSFRKQCLDTLLESLKSCVCRILRSDNKMPFQRHESPKNTHWNHGSSVMNFAV